MIAADALARRPFDNFLSVYLSVTGDALLIGGALMLVRGLRLSLFGTRAEGEVVRHEVRMQHHRGEGLSYMPVVKFHAAGVPHEFQSRTGGDCSTLPVGARVQIRYLPSRPQRAEIAGGRRLWLVPLVLILFGLVLLFGALKASS